METNHKLKEKKKKKLKKKLEEFKQYIISKNRIKNNTILRT